MRREEVDQALRQVEEIAERIVACGPATHAEAREKLTKVDQAIRSLQQAGEPIPEELQQRRRSLLLQDYEQRQQEEIRAELVSRIRAVLEKLGPPRGTAGRGNVAVPIPPGVNDGPDLTFKKPCRVIIAGEDAGPVSSWKEAIVVALGTLLRRHPEVVGIVRGWRGTRKPVLSSNKRDFNRPELLPTGDYVETCRSAEDSYRLIQRVAEACGETVEVETV